MTDHEDRRRSLDALAVLAGFRQQLLRLPDGSIPDVLRLDTRTRGLFVGDAKDTETGTETATYLRLRRYACWIRAHQDQHSTDRHAVLALCVPADLRVPRWSGLLGTLVDDVGLPVPAAGRADLADEESVVWMSWGRPVRAWPTAPRG